jgi:hypothetical protein
MLTTAQAAAALGLSVQRVRAILKARPDLGTKHGRDWLIPPAALTQMRTRPVGYPKGRPRK